MRDAQDAGAWSKKTGQRWSNTPALRYSVSTHQSAKIVIPAWEKLSERSRWTARAIALPLSWGLSISEVAQQAGMKPKEAKKRLDELAAELLDVSETG